MARLALSREVIDAGRTDLRVKREKRLAFKSHQRHRITAVSEHEKRHEEEEEEQQDHPDHH